MRRAILPALVLGALLSLAPPASAPDARSPEDRSMPKLCRIPGDLIDDVADFPHAARRVAKERRLTIVTIGGASTAGMGASAPGAAWPHRLQEILGGRLEGVEVKVVNLAQRGQTARLAVELLPKDVAPLHPDLVIWETGTVDAVRQEDLDQFPVTLTEGTDEVASMDADLILMTPQFARETERMINFQPYIDAMRQTAGLPGVNLFPRHAIMRYWTEKNQMVPASRVDTARGNDQIYDCIAQLLVEVIDRGIRQAARAAQ